MVITRRPLRERGGGRSATELILAADWSKDSEDRAVWKADVSTAYVERVSWRGGSFSQLLELAEEVAIRQRVLVAVDAAFGLPRAAWELNLGGVAVEGSIRFPTWLAQQDPNRLGVKVSDPRNWSPSSPFVTLPTREGRNGFVAAVGARMLKRAVDDRAGAKIPYLTGLPGYVGATSQSIWLELTPLLSRRAWGFWPFDGTVGEILARCGLAIGEFYPALMYRVAGPEAKGPKKSKCRSRASWLAAVREEKWIRDHGVQLGCLDAPEVNDNEFDACAGALALLRMTLEKGALDSVGDDPISEGGILGLDFSLGQRRVVSRNLTGKGARGR